MGKRKLHFSTFYQCEWTGFCMKSAHCYMPSCSPNGKLIKKGSYCNWEAVVAHAAWLLNNNVQGNPGLTPDEHVKILEHIEFITGTHPSPAPHYEELLHTKGRLDANAFHNACVKEAGPITGVKITPTGEIFETILTPDDEGKFDFNFYMHKPYNHLMTLSTFHSMRKKGALKGTDRDLSVWYYATKDLPHNQTASNLFKMQLYGDVLLVQQSREASFLPRERYISFNKGQFDEQFQKRKRNRQSEPPSLSPEAYAELKSEMQCNLNAIELNASASAVKPQEMSKALNVAPMHGKTMAQKIRERQMA